MTRREYQDNNKNVHNLFDKNFIKEQLSTVVHFNKKLKDAFDNEKHINRSNFGYHPFKFSQVKTNTNSKDWTKIYPDHTQDLRSDEDIKGEE